MPPRKLVLQHKLAPGDATAFTAVVRDLKLSHPEIEVDVRTNFPAIFQNNPHLTPLNTRDKGVSLYLLGYREGIRRAGRGEKIHFLTAFHSHLRLLTGIHAPVLRSKPDLHLTDYEQSTPPISGRYWLVFGGGKSDMTIKHWRYKSYQEVVDQLLERGIHCVQSGSQKRGHTHPPLNNCTSVVGWGYVRELLWQVYHCEGVVAPTTFAMHVAAAFDKPAVIIGGGREETHWAWYTNRYGAFGPQAEPVKVEHRYLNTLGNLACCATRGCWRKKIIKVDADTSLCHRPLVEPGQQPLAECMAAITPEMAVQAVMSYYADGTLPPVN